MEAPETDPLIAIACGGTGGHLFPGLAVAEVLEQKGCEIALLISAKRVDQDAVKSTSGRKVITLPAVALQNRNFGGFLHGAWKSYRVCRSEFQKRPPRAVLAMGGFTSAPPILAGKKMGAATFVHEANAIPGRANRWLVPWVDEYFLSIPAAGRRISAQNTTVTGMPVRPQFEPLDPGACRMALGFAPDQPMLLITGGSQGASGINELVRMALPEMTRRMPRLQFLHLTGAADFERIRAEYAAAKCRAQVFPFLTEMELALGAATLLIGRAGASSLAELAAMRVPSILVPYPAAADNHQFYNARAIVETGGARQLNQSDATPELLGQIAVKLLGDDHARLQMSRALEGWNTANAAEQVATRMLRFMGVTDSGTLRNGQEDSIAPRTLRAPSEGRGGSSPLLLQTLEAQ